MQRIDENAFIAAYDAHADAIFRYCYFRVFDRERAKELMQDTFLRAWEYVQKGTEVENLRALLYRIAHNLSVNEVRRHKAYSIDEMQEVAGYDPEDHQTRSPEEEAEVSLVLRHIARLDPAQREVLTLRYIEGLSVSDIAAIRKELPNTVSVRIARALKELRTRIQTP